MKIQPYIEKLNNSQAYKKFKEQYPNAFLVAGFFILDFETKQNIHQIDYYIPSEKKVAAFNLDAENVELKMMEMMTEKTPEELDIQTNIDLDALQGILDDEMKNRSMTEEIKKIIAVVQTVEGKKIWILNCILSGMEILKSHVEDDSKTVLKMEKASVLDYVKKIPGAGAPQQGKPVEPTKEDLDKQLKQLDKLKEVLQKEKEELEKDQQVKKEKQDSK